MNFFPFILLFIGGLVLTVGDLVMKKWVTSSNIYLYISGLLIYLVGMLFLVETYKYKNIAVASLVFILFNIVTLLIFSWFYFKEPLSPMQMVGLLLGIASITLLEIF